MDSNNKDTSPIIKSEHRVENSYDCFYDGKQFSPGAIVCIEGEQYKCGYGAWMDIGKPCHQDEEGTEVKPS